MRLACAWALVLGPVQIYRACEDGDLSEVKRGIKAGASLEKLHQGQFTPLFGAARHGHLDVVKVLLQVGGLDGWVPGWR